MLSERLPAVTLLMWEGSSRVWCCFATWRMWPLQLPCCLDFFHLKYEGPSELHCTLEVIHKIIMELDAADLSRKAQSLRTKVLQ
ncbi:hypothetical protein SRHO_G00032540 [Serrasalmus rhombeus]